MKIFAVYSKIIIVCCFLTMLGGCSFWGLFKKAPDLSVEQTWRVEIDKKKVKTENEYDAIVVGSGIGGLSCASLLAKEGCKVLVLEQHTDVGGYCSSYTRNGFTFSVGVEDVSGFWVRGMTNTLLMRLGLRRNDLFVLNSRGFFFDDKKIMFSGTRNDFVEQLSRFYPEEKDALERFLKEAQIAIMQSSNKMVHNRKPYNSWLSVTYKQKLDEFFKNEELKKLLSSLLGYIGQDASQVLACQTLMPCLQYFIYGGCYPKGGPLHFAHILKDFIEKNNGKVITSCKVDRILVENNHVTGVVADKQEFRSPIVIANANAKTVFLSLIPSGVLDEKFLDTVAGLKMSQSVAVVNLGVDMDLSQLPILIKRLDKDNKVHMVINSNADESLAPQGKASISMITKSSYKETPALGTPEYDRYNQDLAQKCIARADKIIPGLKDHVEVVDVLTPRSFEQFTSMPEGAIYAFDASVSKQRPNFKTPIVGLYLASASSVGGGIESVIAAGYLCARDILIGPGKLAANPASRIRRKNRFF